MNPRDKINNLLTSSNQPSKRGRGRPRKSQSVKIEQKPVTVKKQEKIVLKDGGNNDDEIILHLPISLKDISKDNNNSNNVFEDPKKGIIIPKQQDTNIFTINDIQSDSSGNSSNCEVNDVYVYDLKQKIKEQEKSIKQLTKELEECKSLVSENVIDGTNNRKVSKMNINLIDTTSGKQIIVDKTDIACWWCSYNFDSPPCFLPDNYINNTFHVFGCFCTFNCAAAYNLNINDASVWNRYSLLKKLYSIMCKKDDDTDTVISTAPPREVFDKFGGTLKYADYRKTCTKNIKEYRFIMPPMTSIVPLIEEGQSDKTKVSISLADINKKTSLRRTKPLPNTKNTLFETFGIKEN